MFYGFGVWLLLLGVLGASSLIIAKKPDAQQLISKISPYQGWIGVISVVWGIFGILQVLGALSWLGMGLGGLIAWILLLITVALLLALGILLGVGVIKTFVKDPTAQAKMDQTVAKLTPYQGKLGIAAIVLGLLQIVYTIIR